MPPKVAGTFGLCPRAEITGLLPSAHPQQPVFIGRKAGAGGAVDGDDHDQHGNGGGQTGRHTGPFKTKSSAAQTRMIAGITLNAATAY